MITHNQIRAIAFLLLLSSLTSAANPTAAQPITPAADGTGTRVNPDGQQFNIEGGQRSKDGANLFHSFEQFGLDAGQVANFLSNPDIQNILGRITGGDASIINGLIQLTGGNSNLYLMNPAGILFGPNAQLNVPADFFATTATGIGFSEGNWFNAVGDTQWSNLIGTPTQFAFSTLQPGAIINQGNLTLEPGNNLTLLGGTLLNSGTLSAPGGNITLSAVPGESIVRISQENHLLSLDIRTGISGLELPTPQSLPELLTGSGVTHANQVTVNPDGSIQLSGSGIGIDTQTGDNIASGTITTSQGQIAILGNRVAVMDADINASGINGGGTILIGGDYQGNGAIPNAVQTFISPNTTIHADAIESGDGGRVIIWADETTQFFGNISAKGGPEFGDGGFVEVSGLEFLDYQGQVDTFAANGNIGTLLLDPTNIEIVAAGTGDTTNLTDVDAFAKPDIGMGETKLDVTAINEATANVILQATNDITFSAAIDNPNLGVGLTAEAGNDIQVNADITLNQGNVNLNAGGGIAINNATINTGGGNFIATGTGSANLPNGINLDTGAINAGGGNINLIGRGLDEITTNQNRGIGLDNSRVETTGNGIITLEGTGGTGIDRNTGIFVNNSTIVSGNGDITLTGTGGDGMGEQNRGITFQNGSIVESTGGAIAIIGTGGTGTDSNLGIGIDSTTVSGNGDITLTGTGVDGTGQLNLGVSLQNGTIVESTGGAVAITGTGGTGTNNNAGIFVFNTTVSGNGDITLNGIGGNGTEEFNRGVALVGGSLVESTGGAVAITGTGGTGTDSNAGILVFNTTVSGNGDITLTGTGGEGTEEFNRGVALLGGSLVESTGGAVAITGTAGTGTDLNTGIVVDTGTTVLGNGDITLNGTGGNGNAENNSGIILGNGSIVQSAQGTVAMTGSGGTGTDLNAGISIDNNTTVFGKEGIALTGTGGEGIGQNNQGVSLQNGSRVESTAGAVAITGTGGRGTNNNEGIVVNTNTTVLGNGDITLTGTGGEGTGQNNGGVGLINGILVESTGGAVVITGTGGRGTTNNEGIFIDNTTLSGNGDITLTGTGGEGTGQNNGGVGLNGTLVESTGGAIAIIGTGGTGTNNNEGIFIDNTTLSGNVDITLTGTGGGTGQNNGGVTLIDGTLMESTAGTVAITGTGSAGTDSNIGIFLGTDVTVFGNGDITFTGIGGEGTGQSNQGVTLQDSSIVESTGGAVVITGTGGTGTDDNEGIFVDTNTTVLGNGDITLTGTGGGAGQNNRGVTVQNGSRVESTGGAVAITGTGGNGTHGNTGILVSTNPENTATPTTITSGNGNITLLGTGNGTGENNQGIVLVTTLTNPEPGQVIPSTNLESTGTGTITLEGMGANGVEGIRLENSLINGMGTGSGDVIFRSNNIHLLGESRIFTNGLLTLAPIAPGQDISINNTIAEYNLTTEELLMLDVSSGLLTLGSETVGKIYLGSLDESIDLSDANYDLTLKTGQGIYANSGIITNTQNITLDGAFNLLNPVTFTTNSGNLTFTNKIDGSANLTLDAGTGNIAINGAVGSQTELGNLTILNANTVTTESIHAASLTQVAGTGSIIVNGELVTTGANGINLTTNQIIFNAPVTTTGGGGLTLNNTSPLAIATPIHLDGTFQQIGTGEVTLSNSITTNHQNIQFAAPVTLTGEGSLNPGTGGLVFGANLDAGNNPLTLTAGQIEFNGPVTGTNTLTLQPATTTQNMTLGDNNIDAESLHLTRTELEHIQDGFTAITLGRADSSGTISIVNPLTFLDPIMIEAGAGTLAVNGMIAGSDNAALTLNAATIELNSDIITDQNNIVLTGNVILGNDVTLDTNSAGGDITVVGNIDSHSRNRTLANLTLNAGTGEINLRGNLGETTPLQSVTVTSNRGTVQGNVITDGGNITFNGAIALAEALNLSTGEGGGNITFAGTVDSLTNLGQNLTLSAGTGTITFNRAVGSLQPLGNIDILNAGTITALDTIASASFRALSSGTMTLQGNLTTTAASGVEIQSTNELTVADITTNGQPLTLQSATANVTTGNLDTSSTTTGGAIAVTSTAGEITTGNLTASGVSQGGNINIIAQIAITAGEIDSSATLGNAGNVFLDPIGDIQVSWINAQGGSNGRGGDVFIETTGGFFRAMQSFASQYSPTGFASISTAGGTGGGSITLKHQGGDLGGPIAAFEIGNPTLNGTADVILTGTSILAIGESFPRSLSQGNITIATDDGIDPLPEDIQEPIAPLEPIVPGEPAPAVTPEPAAQPTPPPAPAVTPEPAAQPTPPPASAVTPEPAAQPTPPPAPEPAGESTPASTPAPASESGLTPSGGLIFPEILPPGEIASEPATEDLRTGQPVSSLESTGQPAIALEPLEGVEITPSRSVNEALTQVELTRNSRSTSVLTSTPETILTVSPSLTLPLFSSAEPEPAIAVKIPTEITLESPQMRPRETRSTVSMETSLFPLEGSRTAEYSHEVPKGTLELDTEVTTLEEAFSREFIDYLKYPTTLELFSLNEIREVLRKTEEVTDIKTAVVYIVFGRTALNENAALICPNGDRPEDELGDRPTIEEELAAHCDRHPHDPVELVVVTGVEKPLRLQIPEANRELVEQLSVKLQNQVTDLRWLFRDTYLESSQALYQLLIAPMEPTLKERGIENLVFIPDAGLRSLPFAALHNGEEFLIENYSLSLMPTFSLTQPRYVNLKTDKVLAMGTTQFDILPNLPAVSAELKSIVCPDQLSQDNCWPGEVFLNERFTFNALQQRGNSGDFRMIHLATHADFQSGDPANSYIQLWDKRLNLTQMQELQWHTPEVELLVLSSCRTAVGDEQAELGFAGLALQSGVKSAIASVWYVNDEATLGLMSELYQQLRSAPIRAEGLRRAQLEMLRGTVRLEGGQLISSNGAIALPKELVDLTITDFSHPYYWAGFTAIGNPW